MGVLKRFCHFKYLLILVIAIVSSPVQAQLCNGSFGDPVVDITFGSGSGSSPYVPTASYTYTYSTCPNDGYYTITPSTSNCFGNTWHNVLSDHTGGGSFLLVNASYQPGDFFLTTVADLCPNTTYEFAAWVMNVMNVFNSILPNLTFSVETPGGTVLNSFSTGDIPVTSAPQWNQYGLIFTTPVNNPVIVLRITNHAPGGVGNDLALDDITFRPCGSKITANISGLNTDTVNVCETDDKSYSYTFNATTTSGYISPLYQWQLSTDNGITWTDIPGAVSQSYQTPGLHTTGNYWYRFTVIEASVANISSCKIASGVLKLNIHPKPEVNAGPDRIMLINKPITLSGMANGEQVTYTWSPDQFISDIHQLNPTVSPPADITYTLTATSSWGCMNADMANIKVVSGIFVPTAFTPNGDGKNDRWEIPYLDPSFGGTVNVFNRWGQLVYHVSSAVVSWDGTVQGVLQPAGVYAYVVTFKNNSLVLKGTVTLIR
ncbi:MAG: gliding motility-associated C-terminal domain-containing protein [Bacteroidetes bacterium]|nr:gliding motility-associated C-terminal domain-containing protein [Bacteroidota bacterium]MBS1930436.1 gliding motility-associated C-terminal domain-containing protein [Bacteroidota bacterium]